MEIESLEVYSRDSNYAVIKPPGRKFPGCVLQGDSLSILCGLSKNIANFIKGSGIQDEEFLGDVQELNQLLVGRILHYQRVLTEHGIEYPHVYPFTENDIVTLLPDTD